LTKHRGPKPSILPAASLTPALSPCRAHQPSQTLLFGETRPELAYDAFDDRDQVSRAVEVGWRSGGRRFVHLRAKIRLSSRAVVVADKRTQLDAVSLEKERRDFTSTRTKEM
jgi:hypothetical protein